ncbi:hypothetical protein [Effusibacillus pohliae]|uniref:hypothetical protein n=1 Tax=Effusibacillus pohliae TaxID=232270 RepID=UPI00037B5FC5|nr:hypothetical protein [Effusibacillus pohliae]
MAIAGRKALIKVSGAPVAFVNAPTTPNADSTGFQITDPNMRILDPQAAIQVERSTDGGANWTVVPVAEYKLNRLTGTVEFAAAQTGAQVRVSGSYLPLTTAGEAYEFKYTMEADNQDATTFQSDYVKRTQGLKDVSASLSQWYVDRTFVDKLTDGRPVLLEFYVDAALGVDLRMWATPSSDEVSASADGLVEEALEFDGTTDADGRMVA